MEARGKLPVSLPHPSPTKSYWQDPPDPIADQRTTNELPSSVDFVVIGSGISGACIAYNLLAKRPAATVVMLEARQACSGATGRNGGHTKAASYRSFETNAENHSPNEAILIARLQAANIEATHTFARKHNIPCDSNPCRTVDIVLDQGQWDTSVRSIEYMRRISEQAGLYSIEEHTIVEMEDARAKYHCPEALGAVEYDAGSISAYKFTIGVIKLALEKGLNLQTNTPVTHLEEAASGEDDWRVYTDRGVIKAPNVILATNGYTAALWPLFQGIIVPLRGQITAQRPGRSLPALPVTYSFIYESGYEYMIPRPPGSKFAGDIVIGGGWGTLSDAGAQEFGITNDGTLHDEVSGYLKESARAYFGRDNWGEDDEKGRVRQEWTGIMGTSADGLPYVGSVPGTKGLWVSASFDGHGMVLCLKCAEALTTMIIDCSHSSETASEVQAALDEWFPKSFRMSEKRLEVAFQGRLHVKAPVDTVETRSHL